MTSVQDSLKSLLEDYSSQFAQDETSIGTHLVTQFSLEQNNFFLEHKLSPVHLTWLHLVYGKILFYVRHPDLMVSEGKLYYIIFFVFGQKILVFYYCQLCVDRCQVNKDIFYDRCLCHMFLHP